jgi:hypothetical protein
VIEQLFLLADPVYKQKINENEIFIYVIESNSNSGHSLSNLRDSNALETNDIQRCKLDVEMIILELLL